MYLIEKQNHKYGLTTQMSNGDATWRTTWIPFKYDTIYGLDEFDYFIIDDNEQLYHDFERCNNWCVGQKDGYLDFFHLNDKGNVYMSKNQYDDVKIICSFYSYSDLRIAVKQGGKWGIIDKDETIIVPIEYDEIDYLNAKNGLVRIRKGEKWGVNSLYNKFSGTLTDYDKIEITDSKNPLFIAKMKDNWGLISLCDIILPFEYQEMRATEYPNYYIVKKDDKYGVWDMKKFSMLIEPKFIYLTDTELINVKNKPKKALFVYSTEKDELFWVDKNGENYWKSEALNVNSIFCLV